MIRAMGVSALVALMGVSSMAQAPQAPQVPLFAFASPDAAAAWQAVNDGVMGGVSDGRFRITERQTMEFYGTLSLENNGGFASVRSRPRTLGLQAGDTLIARVRGDGREYQLNLYTSRRMMAFSYRAPVQTRTGAWIDVAVALDRFEATSFGRVVRGRARWIPAASRRWDSSWPRRHRARSRWRWPGSRCSEPPAAEALRASAMSGRHPRG